MEVIFSPNQDFEIDTTKTWSQRFFDSYRIVLIVPEWTFPRVIVPEWAFPGE